MAGSKSNTAGSITPKGPGRWIVRVQLGVDANGKRVREHRVIIGTRRDAQDHLTELLNTKRKDKGLAATVSRLRLGEWVAEYQANYSGSKGPRTRFDQERVFRRMFKIDRELGGVELTKLTPQRIQRFIATLQRARKYQQVKGGAERIETDAPLSPRTIRIYHGALRTVLNKALRLGMIGRNPATLVDLPRTERTEKAFLAPEQAERFLAASVGERFHALFATLILAGLRPGEAFALHWSDLDGDKLRVQRALVWLPGKDQQPIFASTKTGRARTIALGDRLVRILQRHRVQQIEWRLKMGGTYQDQGLLFATELGGPLRLSSVVRRHFHPLLKKAGLSRINLYSLRHSHASLSLAAGVDVKVIQERLGHASITLTLDTYVHASPGMQEKAAGQLDALLASTKAAGAARVS